MASTTRDEISRLELLHAAHPDGLVFPHLADAYRRAGRYSQADAVLTRGLSRHSDYFAGHVVLGRLRLDQGRHDEAARAFQRVLELDAENHMALEYLGRIALEQGRLEEALARFRRLASLRPTREVRERVEELERRVQRAREDAEPSAVPAAPRNRVGPELARLDEPIETPSEDPEPDVEDAPAADRDPEGDALDPGEVMTETMAELYTRQGLHDRAAMLYRRLLARSPGDTRLRERLEAAEAAARPPAAGAQASSPTEDAPAPPLADPATRESGAVAGRAPEVVREEPPRTAAPPIRQHLQSVLSWATPEPEPERARQPAVPAVGSEPAERVHDRADGRPVLVPGLEDAPGWVAAVTDTLVGLLEYRTPERRGRSSLVRLLAERLAGELGLAAGDQAAVGLAALLSDIGHAAEGPDEAAPSGEEAGERRRRRLGRTLRLLDGARLPRAIRDAVRHRHERWDGRGYPGGLAGREIPPLARVLAVAESFVEEASPQPDRQGRTLDAAARSLLESSGLRHDPTVVRALVRLLDRRAKPLDVAERPRVLLVDPDGAGAAITATRLGSSGYLASVADGCPGAVERLDSFRPSALVVSARAGRKAVAELVRAVRSRPGGRELAVLVVDADPVGFRVWMLEHGADVCFPPASALAEVTGTLAALIRRQARD